MLLLPAKGLRCPTQLAGRPVAHCHSFAARPVAARRQPHRRQQLRVSAARWPDQELIDQVLEDFPDKGVASVEEGRALVSNAGYKYLDVRPAIEVEDVGKVTGAVNVPVANGRKKWSSEKKKKVYTKAKNPDFIAQMEKAFPDKEAKLLVSCSDGKRYSMDALMELDEAGYTNIVGLKGGYMGWFKIFDNKGNRRVRQEYVEDHFAPGGDSAGIHGSGAGFNRSDFVELFAQPEYEDEEEE